MKKMIFVIGLILACTVSQAQGFSLEPDSIYTLLSPELLAISRDMYQPDSLQLGLLAGQSSVPIGRTVNNVFGVICLVPGLWWTYDGLTAKVTADEIPGKGVESVLGLMCLVGAAWCFFIAP